MKDLTKIVLVCIVAGAGNFVTAYIFIDTLQFPLFMDTIFTVAVVFYCGLIPALTVAVTYNILEAFTLTIRGFPFEPYVMLFGISGALIVLATWFFARKKEEFKINLPITLLYLVLIAVISSFCSIISSGIVDYIRYTMVNLPDRMAPIKNFTDSFVNQHFSLFTSCILAQIPVSLTDRLLTTFLGYGLYKMMVQLFGEEKW